MSWTCLGCPYLSMTHLPFRDNLRKCSCCVKRWPPGLGTAQAGASVETVSHHGYQRIAGPWRSCAAGGSRDPASPPRSSSGSSCYPDKPCSSSFSTRSPCWCWRKRPLTAGCDTVRTGAIQSGALAPRTWLTLPSCPAAAAGGSGRSSPRQRGSTVASSVPTDNMAAPLRWLIIQLVL